MKLSLANSWISRLGDVSINAYLNDHLLTHKKCTSGANKCKHEKGVQHQTTLEEPLCIWNLILCIEVEDDAFDERRSCVWQILYTISISILDFIKLLQMESMRHFHFVVLVASELSKIIVIYQNSSLIF